MQNITFDIEELIHMASYASQTQRVDLAIHYLKQAKLQSVDHEQIDLMLAGQYQSLGLYRRALAIYDSLIEQGQQLSIAKVKKLTMLFLLSDMESIKPLLDEFTAMGTESAHYWIARGVDCIRRKEIDDAEQSFVNGLQFCQQDDVLNLEISLLLELCQEQAMAITEPQQEVPGSAQSEHQASAAGDKEASTSDSTTKPNPFIPNNIYQSL